MIKTLVFCAFLACAFATRNWAGSWFVTTSTTSDLSACDVPESLHVVNITANGSNLILEGESANDMATKTWILNWSDEDQGYSYCISDWCVSGFLTYEKGATFANISWHMSDDPTKRCSTLLSPATLNWVGRWFVSHSEFARSCSVPASNSVVKIEAFGDQLLMAGYDSQGGALTSWTFNFTAQQQHVPFSCENPTSICLSADMKVSNWMLLGNLSWVNYGSLFYSCNATLLKLPLTSDIDGENDGPTLNYQEDDGSLFTVPGYLNSILN